MPIYHRLGKVPKKRHTVFRKPDGKLYYEELIGNLGFAGPSSLLYHIHRPTQMRASRLAEELEWKRAEDRTVRPHHLRTGKLPETGDPLTGRHPLLFNAEIAVSAVHPTSSQDYFYRNSQGDELFFIAEGTGTIESIFGELPYRKGDYVLIPRGIIHRWRCEAGRQRLLLIESRGYVRTPKRYRNRHGQLLEHSPFCERDIRRPERLQTYDEIGDFEVRVKQNNMLLVYTYAGHPFDVVGWDGFYYPWALNIEDFEPITGRIHQPPPVHQTFEADGFVVCSFVPRLFDYHPDAVPAPYNHSNVGTDELLYYAGGEFMSRKGIESGSITLHPDGLTHGPHPGTVEASIGAKATNELAVMIDTFRPIALSREAEGVEDPDYLTSWLDSNQT